LTQKNAKAGELGISMMMCVMSFHCFFLRKIMPGLIITFEMNHARGTHVPYPSNGVSSFSDDHQSAFDALEWAQKNGINPNDIQQIIAKIRDHRLRILPSQIIIGSMIDKGSFGSICLAEYKGNAVVIKRLSTVTNK
jgi:hypothetical protein